MDDLLVLGNALMVYIDAVAISVVVFIIAGFCSRRH